MKKFLKVSMFLISVFLFTILILPNSGRRGKVMRKGEETDA